MLKTMTHMTPSPCPRRARGLLALSALSLGLWTLGAPHLSSAQSCNLSDNVSFIWTSPPNVDVLSNDSARWGTSGSLRFAFLGDWCPIPEDVSFEDEDGNPIPATIFFSIPPKSSRMDLRYHRSVW